jgi:hypothetical protein
VGEVDGLGELVLVLALVGVVALAVVAWIWRD